jgi:hypothetical protein
MKEVPNACSKCGGNLVQGFSVEYIISYGMVGFWVEGEPKKSWQGAKVPSLGQCIPIALFRCADCGFLESYARPEFAMK